MSSVQSINTPQDYVNYTFNLSSRGITEVTSELAGMSSTVSNLLGLMAFKTSEYLTHTEALITSFGFASAAAFASATQEAMRFEQAVANVQAIGGESINAMEIGQAAMQYSSQFGMDVNSMTEGLEALSRAGLTATNVMSGVLAEGVKLSKLEGIDLEDSINDLIATTNLLAENTYDVNSAEYAQAVKEMNQHIVSTSESAPINAQNIIQSLQHVGGYVSANKIDQDDLFAVIAQLGSKGTKGEMAGTALRAFVAAGQKDQAQRALKRIGLKPSDLWDASGEAMLPISEMKSVLDEALEGRGYSQQEKLEFYSDFAGYKQANQIMKINVNEVQQYKESIAQAWDLGKKLETILGTAHNNIQILFQTVKNFMTKVGQNALPIISAIVKPITLAMQIIDKIPFSDKIVGIGLGLMAVRSILLVINRVVPAIGSLYTSINKSNDRFKSLHDYAHNFKQEILDAKDTLENIGNRDWLANKRLQEDVFGGAQNAMVHKEVSKDLYQLSKAPSQPDWYDLPSYKQEHWHEFADSLQDTDIYQALKQEKIGDMKINFSSQASVLRAKKSKQELNQETAQAKSGISEIEKSISETSEETKNVTALLTDLNQYQAHVINTIKQNIDKGSSLQYDIGKGIMSVADIFADKIAEAIDKKFNSVTYEIGGGLSYSGHGNIGEDAADELKEIFNSLNIDDLPDISFAYQNTTAMEKAMKQLEKDIKRRAEDFANIDVMKMSGRQARRSGKDLSLDYLHEASRTYSANRNEADVRHLLTTGNWRDPKDETKGIRLSQLDKIEKILRITSKRPENDRAGRLHDIYNAFQRLKGKEKDRTFNQIVAESRNEWLNFLDERSKPGAEPTSHIDPSFAKEILDALNVQYDSTANIVTQLQNTFQDFKKADNYGMVNLINQMLFANQKSRSAGVYTESETSELKYMIEHYLMLQKAINKDEKTSYNTGHYEDNSYHTGEYGPQINGSGDVINSFLEDTSVLQNDIESILNDIYDEMVNITSISNTNISGIKEQLSEGISTLHTSLNVVSSAIDLASSKINLGITTTRQQLQKNILDVDETLTMILSAVMDKTDYKPGGGSLYERLQYHGDFDDTNMFNDNFDRIQEFINSAAINLTDMSQEGQNGYLGVAFHDGTIGLDIKALLENEGGAGFGSILETYIHEMGHVLLGHSYRQYNLESDNPLHIPDIDANAWGYTGSHVITEMETRLLTESIMNELGIQHTDHSAYALGEFNKEIIGTENEKYVNYELINSTAKSILANIGSIFNPLLNANGYVVGTEANQFFIDTMDWLKSNIITSSSTSNNNIKIIPNVDKRKMPMASGRINNDNFEDGGSFDDYSQDQGVYDNGKGFDWEQYQDEPNPIYDDFIDSEPINKQLTTQQAAMSLDSGVIDINPEDYASGEIVPVSLYSINSGILETFVRSFDDLFGDMFTEEDDNGPYHMVAMLSDIASYALFMKEHWDKDDEETLAEQTLQDWSSFMISKEDVEKGYNIAKEQFEQSKYNMKDDRFGMFTGPLIGDAGIYEEAEQQHLSALIGQFMGMTVTNQIAGTAVLRAIYEKREKAAEAFEKATETMENVAKHMEDIKNAMYPSDISTKTPLLEAGESILQIAEISTAQGQELNKAFEDLIFNMKTASEYFAQEDWQNQPMYHRDPRHPQWQVTIDTYSEGVPDDANIMLTPALTIETIIDELLSQKKAELGRELYDSEKKYYENQVRKNYKYANADSGVVYYTGAGTDAVFVSQEQKEALKLKTQKQNQKNIANLEDIEKHPQIYHKFFNQIPPELIESRRFENFIAKKTKSMTASDREFLSQTYDIDISNARTAQQANKIIRNTLENMGELYLGLEQLYNHYKDINASQRWKPNQNDTISDMSREDLLDVHARQHMINTGFGVDISNADSLNDLSETEYRQLYTTLVMLYGEDRVNYGEGKRKSLQQLIDLHAYEMMKRNAQVELNKHDNFDEKRQAGLEKDRQRQKSILLGSAFGHSAKGLTPTQSYVDIVDAQFNNPELDELSQSYAVLETSGDLFDITKQMLGGVELFKPPSKARSDKARQRDEFLTTAKLMYPEIFKQVMNMSASERKQFRKDFETGNLQTIKDIQLAELQKQYPGQFKMVSSFSEEKQKELAKSESNMPMHQIARALTSTESNYEELSIMNDIIKVLINDNTSYTSTSSVDVNTSDKHNNAFDAIRESNETLEQQQNELQKQIEYESEILNQIIDDVNYTAFTDAIDEIKKGIQLKADVLSIIARGKRQHEDAMLAEETEKENEKLTQALKDAEEYYENSQKAYTPVMGGHLVTPDVIDIANQQIETQKNIQAQQKRVALLGQIERGEYVPINELEEANLHGWIDIQKERNAKIYKDNIINELPLVGTVTTQKDPTHRNDTKLTTQSQVTDSKWITFLNDWIEEEYQEGGIEQLEHRFAQIKKSALKGGHGQRTHVDRIFAKLLENRINAERELLNQSLLQEKDEQFRQETKVKPAQARKKAKEDAQNESYDLYRRQIEIKNKWLEKLIYTYKNFGQEGIAQILRLVKMDNDEQIYIVDFLQRQKEKEKKQAEEARNDEIMNKVRAKINEKSSLKEEGEKLWADIEREEQMSQDLIRIRTEEDLKNNKMLFDALNQGRNVDDWAIRVMSNLKTDTGKKDFINNILELAKQNKQISAPLLDYFTANADVQDTQKFIQQSLNAMRGGQQIPQQYLDFILGSEYSSDYQKQQAKAYEKINQDRIKEQQRRNARAQEGALKTPYAQRLRQKAWEIRLAELEANLGGTLSTEDRKAYKQMFYEDYGAEDAWKVKKQELIDRGEWDILSTRKQQKIHDDFVNNFDKNFGIEDVSLTRMRELQKEAKRMWLQEGLGSLRQSGQWQQMNQAQRKQAKSDFISDYLSGYRLSHEGRQELEQEKVNKMNEKLRRKNTEERKKLRKKLREERKLLEEQNRQQERINRKLRESIKAGEAEAARRKAKKEALKVHENVAAGFNLLDDVIENGKIAKEHEKDIDITNLTYQGRTWGVGYYGEETPTERKAREARENAEMRKRQAFLNSLENAEINPEKRKHDEKVKTNISQSRERQARINRKRAENFKKMSEQKETPVPVSIGSGMFDYHNFMNDMNNLIPEGTVLVDEHGNKIDTTGQLTQEEFNAKYKEKYKDHAEAAKAQREEKERIEKERLERLQKAQRARKIKESIEPITKLVETQGKKISTFLNQSVFKDAKDGLGTFSETADYINDAIQPLRSFNDALSEVAQTFPILTPLVAGINTVLVGAEKVTTGLKYAEIALMVARIAGGRETEEMAEIEGYKAAKKWAESINKYIDPESWLGQTIGQVGEWGHKAADMAKEGIKKAIKYIEALGPEVAIAVGVVAAVIIAAIAAIWIWEKKHAESLKKAKEELEESTKKQNAAYNAYKSIKQAREAETDAIKKQQIARKEAIALYELEAARIKRRRKVQDEADVRNDAVWGEYGIRAQWQRFSHGYNLLSGDFDSQYEKYDGTTKNIRQIKEETLGNLFATQSQRQVASFYDNNSRFFAEVEAYKEPLQELYDKESKLIEQYGSIDLARGTKDFEDAVQEFADATGINGETAVMMLDWLETENRVDKATTAMQATANMIVAKADANAMKAMYPTLEGKEGFSGIENAMIMAQAESIYKDAYDQMWWDAFGNTLWGYFNLILSFLTGGFGVWGDFAEKSKQHFGAAEAYNDGMKELVDVGINGLYEQGEEAAANAERRNYGNGVVSYGDTPFGWAIESDAAQYASHRQEQEYLNNGHIMSDEEFVGTQNAYSEHRYGATNEQLKQQKTKAEIEAYEKAKANKAKKADTTLGQLQNNGEQAHNDALAIIDAIKGQPGMISGLGAGIFSLTQSDSPLMGSLRKRGLKDIFKYMEGEEGTLTGKVVDFTQRHFDNAQTAYADDGLKGVYRYGKETVSGKLANSELWGKITNRTGRDALAAQKRGYMTAADREFLSQKYNIDISDTRTAKQANKRIINSLDEAGKFDEGMSALHREKYGRIAKIKGFGGDIKTAYNEGGLRGIYDYGKGAIGQTRLASELRTETSAIKGVYQTNGLKGLKGYAEGALYEGVDAAKGLSNRGINAIKGTRAYGKISDRIGLAREVNGLAADGVAVSRSGFDKAVGVYDGAKAVYADDGIKGLAKFGKEAGKGGIQGLAKAGKAASGELGGIRGIASSVSSEVGGVRGLASTTASGMKDIFNPKALASGADDIAKGLGGSGSLMKGVGKVGGRALAFLGPALAFADKASELNPFEGKHYNEDGTEKKALQATGEVVGTTAGALGGVAGGLAGAEAGAALGATIGSIIPGVGTVIGGALGAVAGGIAGGWLGDTIFQPIGDAIGGTIGWLGDNLLGGIQDVAGTVWNGLTGAAGGVWDAVSGAATGVWDFITGNGGNQPIGGLLGMTPIGMGVNAAAGIWDWLSGGSDKGVEYGDSVTSGKKEKESLGKGNTIIIKNININTEDDPEKIKTAFMNLMIEMEEQITPRQVSRVVGEPNSASASSDASTDATNPNNINANDQETLNQNNNNPTT